MTENLYFNKNLFYDEQWFFMRDMERLMGPWRLCIVFLGAGMLDKCFTIHRQETFIFKSKYVS